MLTTDVRIYNDDGYMYRKCQFVFAFFYKLTSQGNCFSCKKFIFISKIRSFFNVWVMGFSEKSSHKNPIGGCWNDLSSLNPLPPVYAYEGKNLCLGQEIDTHKYGFYIMEYFDW